MPTAAAGPTPQGVVAVADLVRVGGPDAEPAACGGWPAARRGGAALQRARSRPWMSRRSTASWRGARHVVVGGGRRESGDSGRRGRDQGSAGPRGGRRDALADLALLVTAAAAMASRAPQAIEGATARLHQGPRSSCGATFDAQLGRAREEGVHLESQGRDADGRAPCGREDDGALEGAAGRGASGDREGIESRQVGADERFAAAQAARRHAQSRRGVVHACGRGQGRRSLVERAAALVAEVTRLEEAAREPPSAWMRSRLKRTQKTARRLKLEPRPPTRWAA